MRVHLASIAASRKAAQQKPDEIKTDYEGGDDDNDDDNQLKECSKNQSNSSEEEEIKNCEGSPDFGDGDQSNSNYGLRENPKKSWRISDPTKRGLIKNGAVSCKQCGKNFPSLRALSGHMRCHSIKNNNSEVHRCKECGKEFGSIRAMFGHMKSHSKKSRARDESVDQSLSDLDNLCPVRRKRSRIHYNIAPIESTSQLEAAEEAALCLMMLSRGVGDWSKVDSVAECSDDCSAYFGGGDDKKETTKTCLSLDCCISGYASVYSRENLAEFDDHDSKFVVEDEMKVESGVVDDDKLLIVKNGMKAEKLCGFAIKLDGADDSMSDNPIKSTELDKDFFVANEVGEVSSVKKGSVSVNEPDSEKNSVNEVLKDSEMTKRKKPEYKCRARDNKVVHSHRSLGGCIARHKLQGSSTVTLPVTEADSELDQLKCSNTQLKQERCDVGFVSLKMNKTKEHECPICFKVFTSGQALGGHKRAHYTVNQEAVAAQVHDTFDLNFPVNEGANAEVGRNLWWVERRSHEREALVLTN